MEVFIKESLYVLDYKDEIVDQIFSSDDHLTPGYAYNINIEESNTGYSNLTFTMPTKISPTPTNVEDTLEEYKLLDNPKLKLLTPLVKLRYNRKVLYTGKEPITVQEPTGYGDTTVFVEKIYSPDYPNNIIEDYTMDYIVQPIDKKRSGYEVSLDFNAIDYPRFNLSKKKFGTTVSDETITRDDWSIYEKKPMDVPGSVKYIQWTDDLSKTIGATDIPLEWDAEKSTSYPISEDEIAELLKQTSVWSYGILSTVFYWPISSTGRFQGTLYNKGDYLTLQIYEKKLTDAVDVSTIEIENKNFVLMKYTWNGSKWIQTSIISDSEILVYQKYITDENYIGDYTSLNILESENPNPTANKWGIVVTPSQVSLDFYGYEWLFLEQGHSYLTPNNACNYLSYILETTNWSIKNTSERFLGTFLDKNFPASAKENDYLIYKKVNSDDYYKGIITIDTDIPDQSVFPTSNVENGDWCFVIEKINDKIVNSWKYTLNNGSWFLDWSDRDSISTYFYEFQSSKWVDVTTEAWTHSIDKKTGVLYDVDEVTTEIATPENTSSLFETTELRAALSLSDSNCYNAITEISKVFQVYPIYDCINRTVSLKLFSGKNYGLSYKLGWALENTGVKSDGEKVITKLRCFGGQDTQGDTVINIGDAERKYIKYFNGFYSSVTSLPTSEVEGYWAIVGDISNPNYWIYTGERNVYQWNGTTSKWELITPQVDPSDPNIVHHYVTIGSNTYDIDLDTGMVLPWNPNDNAYIQMRSPYGTEYIYNFKWMYDNKWITKDEILSIYEENKKIQDINKKFLVSYPQDYTNTEDTYTRATVDYKANQDEYLACLKSMANVYYYNPSSPSEGSFTAFPYVPGGTTVGADGKHYATLYHCFGCGYTSESSFTTCPKCYAKEHIEERKIYIPVFEDFNNKTSSVKDNPKTKGFFQATLNNIGNNLTNLIDVTKPFETRVFYKDENSSQLQFYVNGEWIYDKGGNLYNWNDYVEKWKTYYGFSMDNLALANRFMKKREELDKEYKAYEVQIEKIEDNIQNKYGDYIIEGKFSDDEIVYTSVLFAKSLEASDKYATPEITYNLDVIDSSGLIEYRIPTAEVYNELVHSLHSVGQIVPKAGDYCTIYDEPMGLYGVSGLITKITRVIDSPQKNSIEVNTSYTDSEELVGNIITATNTVLNNSDIYARTAIIKSDGTISAAALNNSFQTNASSNISIVGVNGSSLLESDGLTVSNVSDPTKKMKYAGNGIFSTTDNGSNWNSMITPNGINANYIFAGSIDTHNVQILSGLNSKVVLDNYGLSVKTLAGTSYNLPTSKDSNGFWDWSNTNLSAFIGVNNDNEGLLYLKGQMLIDGGSKIGGWTVLDDKLCSGTGSNYIALSTSSDGYRIWAGNETASSAPFYVTSAGYLKANNVNINGTISAIAGKIADYTISGAQLIGNNVGLSGTSGQGWAFWAGSNDSGSAPFRVGHDGSLYASNATISGSVTATSGTFSNCTVTDSCTVPSSTITGVLNSTHIPTLSANKISGGTLNITTQSGYLRAGVTTNHPEVSGLNVGGYGIKMSDNSISACHGIQNAGGDLYLSSTGGTVHIGHSDSGSSLPLEVYGGRVFVNTTMQITDAIRKIENIDTWGQGGDSIRVRRVDTNGNDDGYYIITVHSGIITDVATAS